MRISTCCSGEIGEEREGEERPAPLRSAKAERPLTDTPDDQRLATAAISSSEDSLDAGSVLAVRRLDVRATILLDAERFDGGVLGSQESHGQKDTASDEEV